MSRVTTNTVSISAARESSLGVLPATPDWKLMEPNAISQFGSTISKTARNPISKSRQRRKGVTTDLESAVELEADLTLAHFRDYMEGFCFARATGAPTFAPTAVAAGAFTIPALSAEDAALLLYSAGEASSLLFGRGFCEAENNSLLVLGDAAAATDTTLTVLGGAVAEAPAVTDDVELSVAGVRAAAGDLQIDADGNLTATALDLSTLGLSVGQWIHVGGPDATNQFFNEENFGFARVAKIEAGKLTLARRGSVYVADDGTADGAGGAGVAIDILFGQFVRNVATDHPDYLEISTQFELELPNLGGVGITHYEYAMGNYHDTVSLSVPLTDKATVTYGFVGTDTTTPSAARASNAENAKVPSETSAFGTSSDIARLVLENVDEEGLTTDFKSVTATISNNVSAEKVLGQLGAKYMNLGNFEVDLEMQLLFTNSEVRTAIRENETLGIYFALRNEDGGVLCDMPSGTLDAGDREFPENQTVLINCTFMAFEDPKLEYSFSASLFPVLPELV